MTLIKVLPLVFTVVFNWHIGTGGLTLPVAGACALKHWLHFGMISFALF